MRVKQPRSDCLFLAVHDLADFRMAEPLDIEQGHHCPVLVRQFQHRFVQFLFQLAQPALFLRVAGSADDLVKQGRAVLLTIAGDARYIAVEDRPHARSEAMRFGLRASGVQAVAAALISGLDHAENQWKNLFARPVPRWTFYFAKLMIVMAMTAAY